MTGKRIRELWIQNVVIGSGAAGFQAASRLAQFGENDVAVITEQVNAGTSRNTGSDKQTYYKLSLAGSDEDSIRNLAEDLFAGQCVDGDLALCEAALSVQCFYRLVELGVPFPNNEFGEYVGYKTDHDRGRRATSAGPYTSKMMTECLEKEVREKNIPILDQMQVIRLLVNDGAVHGILCLDKRKTAESRFVIVWCEHVIYATGGPAGIYQDSVYPVSQIGGSGIAFEAGVVGKNLTEWQFGMASLNPRWNVSGTYMQVLPRVVSTDMDGNDEKEFLTEYFESQEEMLSMTFLKGYQWPFDVNKIFVGSSVIDLLIYQERVLKNRRVFLDFRQNPGKKEIVYEQLLPEVFAYLSSAGACFGTPIERLVHMNAPAIEFYQEHGVDLRHEMLEIAICAQHNNGGLSVDSNWETNIQGLFAVGEVCGSHGVTRPGGSALNAGQVGALRAAEYIAYGKPKEKRDNDWKMKSDRVMELCRKQAVDRAELCDKLCGTVSLAEAWKKTAKRMSSVGGMIRNKEMLQEALEEVRREWKFFSEYVYITDEHQLGMLFHLYDILIAQIMYLESMIDYIKHDGGSRGSALYTCTNGEKTTDKMPDLYKCRLDQKKHGNQIQEIEWKNGECVGKWRLVRKIPELDYFFETQWKAYRERNVN